MNPLYFMSFTDYVGLLVMALSSPLLNILISQTYSLLVDKRPFTGHISVSCGNRVTHVQAPLEAIRFMRLE